MQKKQLIQESTNYQAKQILRRNTTSETVEELVVNGLLKSLSNSVNVTVPTNLPYQSYNTT